MAVEEAVVVTDSIGDPEVEDDELGEGLAELEPLSGAGRETDSDSVIEVDIEVLGVANTEIELLVEVDAVLEAELVTVLDSDGEPLDEGEELLEELSDSDIEGLAETDSNSDEAKGGRATGLTGGC